MISHYIDLFDVAPRSEGRGEGQDAADRSEDGAIMLQSEITGAEINDDVHFDSQAQAPQKSHSEHRRGICPEKCDSADRKGWRQEADQPDNRARKTIWQRARR